MMMRVYDVPVPYSFYSYSSPGYGTCTCTVPYQGTRSKKVCFLLDTYQYRLRTFTPDRRRIKQEIKQSSNQSIKCRHEDKQGRRFTIPNSRNKDLCRPEIAKIQCSTSNQSTVQVLLYRTVSYLTIHLRLLVHHTVPHRPITVQYSTH